jgi:hypothetical protein
VSCLLPSSVSPFLTLLHIFFYSAAKEKGFYLVDKYYGQCKYCV